MGYRAERERFIQVMTINGLPLDVTLRLLREATGLNRRAELATSSEAADRDRVPCPAAKSKHNPCLCDYDGQHHDVPRIAVLDWQAEVRIGKSLPDGWAFKTEGDPRGYVLRVIPPAYADRNKGRDIHNLDAIGVPNGPSGLRWY